VELTVENAYPSALSRHRTRFVCKKCDRIARTIKQELKPERILKELMVSEITESFRVQRRKEYKKRYMTTWHPNHPRYFRDYCRQHYLKINGKMVQVDKRPRPECCEICGRQHKLLGYHHWDDEKLEKGIWVCIKCHGIAEIYDALLDGGKKKSSVYYRTLAKTYKILKDQISERGHTDIALNAFLSCSES